MCSIRATILHADLDAFYASVEQRDTPLLRNKPMAVGGGVILSASYEARQHGVKTAMNLRQARKLCPQLISVEPRMEAYAAASREVMKIFDDVTPLVEPISIDEAFLDVSGLRRLSGEPSFIAQRLRKRVADNVGIPLSIGVARTKFLAKVASGVSKPDGLIVVEPENELQFLHPLGIRKLWGVGKVTEEKLAEKGIVTVGHVANLSEQQLISVLGPASGRHLHALSHNRDRRIVSTGKRRSSIGAQRALGQRHRPYAELETILLELVDRVTRRLREGERAGRTIMVRFRFGDFTRDTRSHSVEEATTSTAVILDVARQLLQSRRQEIADRKLTLLGLTVANLTPSNVIQQSLPFKDRTDSKLDAAVDRIKDLYGTDSLTRAVLIGHQSGLSVPMLPDPKP